MSRPWLPISLAALLALAGAAGLSAEAVGREVTISDLSSEKFLPAVAYNGNHQEYFVVWHNLWGSGLRDIYGARLDRFGRLLALFTVSSGAVSRAQPAVAYDSVRDRYLVVWIEDYWGNGTDWDVKGRLVPWDGPVAGLAEFVILDATDSQWNPKVAYSSGHDEFLVVWSNTQAGVHASIGMRYVFADGTPDWASILAGDASHDYVNPSLAYNPLRNEYLAAYEVDGVDVAARRLTNTGTTGSQQMVADWPDAESDPAVATCPGQDQWLVVWRNATPKVYARFLTGPGLVDGAPLDVFNAFAGDQLAPAVACMPGGARYLIAWEQEYVGALFGLWARSLGTAKAFLTPGFALRPVFGSQTRHARSPALAGGAPGWSAVWVQEREGSTYSDLHGAPVWALFADDFESGDTGFWSSVAP